MGRQRVRNLIQRPDFWQHRFFILAAGFELLSLLGFLLCEVYDDDRNAAADR
jgi:hypothetical protein